MCCNCYRDDTQCLNGFGIAMGVITAIITILNFVIIIDFAVEYGGEYAFYLLIHTAIFAGIGFCNFWYGRKKAVEGDTVGLNTCVLVLFMFLLPAAMGWSYFWILVSIIVNALSGDGDNALLGVYVWYANLVFGIVLMITSWFCAHAHQPAPGQTTTTVTQMAVVQTQTGTGTV